MMRKKTKTTFTLVRKAMRTLRDRKGSSLSSIAHCLKSQQTGSTRKGVANAMTCAVKRAVRSHALSVTKGGKVKLTLRSQDVKRSPRRRRLIMKTKTVKEDKKVTRSKKVCPARKASRSLKALAKVKKGKKAAKKAKQVKKTAKKLTKRPRLSAAAKGRKGKKGSRRPRL